MADKIYKVQTQMADSWQVSAQIGKHTLIVDQAGAGDSGLTHSIPSCFRWQPVSTIAKMVAREQNFVLNGIDVTVEGTLNPSGLAGKPSADPVGFKQIHISADIDAELTAAQKLAFLELVCERCPVHDNIMRTSQVSHSLR